MLVQRPLRLIAFSLLTGMALLSVYRDAPAEETQTPGAAVQRGETERRGAWLDELVFTRKADTGKAVNLIKNNRIQLFAAGISNPTIFNRIRRSAELQYEISYGTSAELTVNPAAFADDTRLNPFQSRPIREALNWLLDREYIANELYGGLAVPRYLPLNTAYPDYARLAKTARKLQLRYRHNPDKAEKIITREMEKLGAEKKNGTWMYKGAPIELDIIIRTEDAREKVGDYVGNLLQRLGFRVHRMYRNAEEASRIWIGTAPKAGKWHLYTGGWAATMINRDQANQFESFYTPRGRPLPLWQAYDPMPELDNVAQRLQRRDYDSWAERQDMMRRGLKLAMKESMRIWFVDTKSVWPHAANVKVTADLAAGIGGSYLWPYTLRYKNRTGGRMKIGAPSFLTEPWNPVAGSNWIHDQMIIRGLSDSAVLPDPYTGLFRPQRVAEGEVTVKTGIPMKRTLDWVDLERQKQIPVPEDAWIAWNTQEKRFVTVGEKHPEGLTARTRTRVTYEKGYLDQQWHDGTTVSVADIVLPWILTFVRGKKDSLLFDRSHVPALKTFKQHFKGWRIISTSPLKIEIYSDQIYPDVEWIAGSRIPGATSWHTLALGILAERNKRLAFSSDKADRSGIEWMNFVAGPSLAILDRQLQRAQRQKFIPFSKVLGAFVDKADAKRRYSRLREWREEKGHFWVGKGPFYLESVRPVEGTVVLHRFKHFPDPADKWLRFDEPEVPAVKVRGSNIVESGDAVEFEVDVTYQDQPYPRNAIRQVGFMFFDSEDRMVAEGKASPGKKAGIWTIQLGSRVTDKMGVGANNLEIAVRSTRVALPSFASFAFGIIPQGTKDELTHDNAEQAEARE